jgi:hypothetical protein
MSGLIDDILVSVDGPGQYSVSHGWRTLKEVAETHAFGRLRRTMMTEEESAARPTRARPTSVCCPAIRFPIEWVLLLAIHGSRNLEVRPRS